MYGETFMTILAIVFLIFGVLQIILFFKVWGMTNRVDDIYKQLNGEAGIGEGWGYEYFVWYCDNIIKKAKRMAAIGDEGAEKLLKGLIYDLNEYMNSDNSSTYMAENIDKYRRLAEETLEQMQK